MDQALLAWLQSQAGRQALAVADALELSAASLLHDVELLRRSYSPEQARALAEQVRLRRRAAAKFPQAALMFFETEALEQSTSAVIANYRAGRFPVGACVADLGCGLGGDMLALAQRGPVIAVDRDPLRLALAEANAAALGLSARIIFEQRDIGLAGPPLADALFCDPTRRVAGRRVFDAERYQPPLSRVLAWRSLSSQLAVKLAPGIEHDALPADVEIEFISRDGELKEAVAWCGTLASAERRATLLRGDALPQQLVGRAQGASAPLSVPLSYLYEPDPAVIRAGLVTDLAQQMGAAQLDPTIAYLTSQQHVASVFARAWPILEWQPWGLKRLRQRLRQLEAGPVTVKKRGSPLDVEQLARQLCGQGQRELVVVLTRMRQSPIMLICGAPGEIP